MGHIIIVILNGLFLGPIPVENFQDEMILCSELSLYDWDHASFYLFVFSIVLLTVKSCSIIVADV